MNQEYMSVFPVMVTFFFVLLAVLFFYLVITGAAESKKNLEELKKNKFNSPLSSTRGMTLKEFNDLNPRSAFPDDYIGGDRMASATAIYEEAYRAVQDKLKRRTDLERMAHLAEVKRQHRRRIQFRAARSKAGQYGV